VAGGACGRELPYWRIAPSEIDPMPWPETNVLEPGSEPLDAINLLRADMDEVDGAFAKYWDVSHDDDARRRQAKVEVARDVCQRTGTYLGLEKAFVRSLESTVADPSLLREMRAGQEKALELVGAIERMDPADTQYDSAVRVLGDFLLKHAEGEREGVFRHVVASRVNLFEIGEQLRQKRAELLAAG
jgi:hypothetical protein